MPGTKGGRGSVPDFGSGRAWPAAGAASASGGDRLRRVRSPARELHGLGRSGLGGGFGPGRSGLAADVGLGCRCRSGLGGLPSRPACGAGCSGRRSSRPARAAPRPGTAASCRVASRDCGRDRARVPKVRGRDGVPVGWHRGRRRRGGRGWSPDGGPPCSRRGRRMRPSDCRPGGTLRALPSHAGRVAPAAPEAAGPAGAGTSRSARGSPDRPGEPSCPGASSSRPRPRQGPGSPWRGTGRCASVAGVRDEGVQT